MRLSHLCQENTLIRLIQNNRVLIPRNCIFAGQLNIHILSSANKIASGTQTEVLALMYAFGADKPADHRIAILLKKALSNRFIIKRSDCSNLGSNLYNLRSRYCLSHLRHLF